MTKARRFSKSPRTLTYSADTFFRHQNVALSVLFRALEASVFADNAAFVASKIVRVINAVLVDNKNMPKREELPTDTRPVCSAI